MTGIWRLGLQEAPWQVKFNCQFESVAAPLEEQLLYPSGAPARTMWVGANQYGVLQSGVQEILQQPQDVQEGAFAGRVGADEDVERPQLLGHVLEAAVIQSLNTSDHGTTIIRAGQWLATRPYSRPGLLSTSSLISVISSMAKRIPSRPRPLCLTPP